MSIIVTDFHSHIFPGADHGSDSVRTSLAQLSLMKKAGVHRIVGTPHFYPNGDSVASFLRRRERSAEQLAKSPDSHMIDVMLGAEVLVCRGMEGMEGIEKLCVLGTRCILLEMPMSKWDDALYETVDGIRSIGLNPVMAHVDRYPPEQVERLFDMGMIAQINASSLLGMFRRRGIMKWVEEGLIVALGSDIHGADEKCASGYTKAVKILGSYADEIMRQTDALIRGAVTLRSAQSGD